MSALPTISDIVATHMAEVRHADLSLHTLHATRRSLLDALGVMLAASGLADDALPYRRHAEQQRGACRLIGSTHRTTPADAALANGALAHALDFGDTFDAGPAHPNAALVPALLALADHDPTIAMEALEIAMTTGCDLACRLSLAPSRPFEAGGWYPPPLVNLIATAAAAAKLLGLPAEGIRDAMGLAMMQGAFPGEIKHDPTSPMRGVREGFVARGAVEAALLAQAGAKAFADPLGGTAGFFALYGGGSATPALTDSLGKRFLGDEVSFKPWPACRGTHAYIEAALELRPGVAGRTIQSIEAEIGPVQTMLIEPVSTKQAPRTPIEARFSIPFTVAAALVDGAVSLDTFGEERLGDAALRAMAAKVTPRFNDGWTRADAARGALRITLEDGSELAFAVAQAAGHPDRPLDDDALVAKFVDCATRAANAPSADRAQALAMALLAGQAPSPSEWLSFGAAE